MTDENSFVFYPSHFSFGCIPAEPLENVIVTATNEVSTVWLVIRDPTQTTENITLVLSSSDIVKCICHLETQPILMLRVTEKFALDIEQMMHNHESVQFTELWPEKWILIRSGAEFTEAGKAIIRRFVPRADEISAIEAGEFIKKFVDDRLSLFASQPNSQLSDVIVNDAYTILTYPAIGVKGAITIRVNDYECLTPETYLNDAIIDFYLKYLYLQVASDRQRETTHIFSSFFYNTLTTRLPRGSATPTHSNAAQGRHDRVKKWTKDVNLFEKDFIIVPVNQREHWFLAIICFPSLAMPETEIASTSNRSIRLSTGKTRRTNDGNGNHVQNANESGGRELRSSTVDQTVEKPCILIFDSMGGTNANTITNLRDYMNCEYVVRTGNHPSNIFTSTNMPGHAVKVPRQDNLTDCGVFLLQYVEQLFKNPIKNYDLPIKRLEKWFDHSVIDRKREDIADLIRLKMTEEVDGFPIENLPQIVFYQ